MRHNHILKMKLFFIALPVILMVSCAVDRDQRDKEKIIAVSILPQKKVVEKIAGDRFDVMVMIPPGSSPATYDPSSRQIAGLSGAQTYLKMGCLGFENAWMERIQDAHPDLRVLNISEGIDLIRKDHDHDGRRSGIDPHTWMSVRNMRILALNTYKAILEADPEHQLEYISRYNQWQKALIRLDDSIGRIFKGYDQRSFIIYHPALSYYARDYHLDQIAIEREGKEPSMKHMARVLSYAKSSGIDRIFVQREFDKAHADSFVKELDGRMVTIDPLAFDWGSQIRYITSQLTQLFKQTNGR